MSSRPRRSAAQRATVAITDLADRDAGVMSSRSRSKLPRGESSPAADSQHMHLTVKVNSSKLRQATNTGRGSAGNQISVAGRASAASRRPTRGAKKRYVESESDEEEEDDEVVGDDDEDDEDDEDDDEEEEEEEEDEIQVGEEDDELEEEDEDAEGEVVEDDAMDIDAEGEDEELGEEDAEGDIDMDMTPAPLPPTIKISKPAKGSGDGGNGRARSSLPPRGSAKASSAQKIAAALADDDDDEEELSELESDVEDEINDTVEVGGQDVVDEDADGEPEEEDVDIDVDAEGEEIEVADEEEDDEEDLDSADDTPGGGSRAETPDLSKMTRRQRARFEDTPQEYMKLSDEVQVKKHFTAEEISMRRQEMARRRRNLSEKRNEEVKTETINKLLKRQAPKNNKRGGQAGGDETPDVDAQRPDPVLIRWISSREGSRTAVPQEVLDGPVGTAFHGGPGGNLSGRMVQEVT